MARFMKKVGTQPLRYQFDLAIDKVELNVPYEVKLIIIMKRGKLSFAFNPSGVGPKRLETKGAPAIGGGKQNATFDETLSMLGTLYKNKTTGEFQERSVSATTEMWNKMSDWEI